MLELKFDHAAAHGPVTLRPRIALEEKAARQQQIEKQREQVQRTKQALAELDEARLSRLVTNQVGLALLEGNCPKPADPQALPMR